MYVCEDLHTPLARLSIFTEDTTTWKLVEITQTRNDYQEPLE
jgi:hypothetical protein